MKEDTDKTWMEVYGGFAKDMTLRDHYAGLAMPAIYHHVERGGFERVSKLSYELADAMLAAREGK